MKLQFDVKEIAGWTEEEKRIFFELLIEQNQVAHPTIEKVNKCPILCIVYLDSYPIGIGAIKNVSKICFDRAGESDKKLQYDFEIGYLYVRQNYNGLGIGKTICRLLLKQLGARNVFATTEDNHANRMKHILESLGFVKIGNSYVGQHSNKNIALMTIPI